MSRETWKVSRSVLKVSGRLALLSHHALVVTIVAVEPCPLLLLRLEVLARLWKVVGLHGIPRVDRRHQIIVMLVAHDHLPSRDTSRTSSPDFCAGSAEAISAWAMIPAQQPTPSTTSTLRI